MKSYHLTQEQALEIARSAGLSPIMQGLSDSVAKPLLKDFANAVLDQVLGEPVAWAEKGRENNVIADLMKQTNKNDWVKPYTVALYAPKEQS